MNITRTFDILDYRAAKSPDTTALAGKRRGEWFSYTYEEYKDIVDRLTLGLINLGIEQGDRIASITPNRPEWNLLDMAIAQAGAIHVSMYPNYNQDDYSYIFQQAEIKYAFTGNQLLYRLIEQLKPSFPFLRDIFMLDGESAKSYEKLLASIIKEPDYETLNERKKQVKGESPYTIYFTSGTAMGPKGAVLQHEAITNSVLNIYGLYQLQPCEVVVSYLPICHAYERIHNYIYQYVGCSVYYADSVDNVVANLEEIKPVMFTSVPMIVERVLEGINQKSSDLLGGRLRMISSAAAALPEQYAQKLWDIGIPVLECYGLSECHFVTINSFEHGIKFGTVGTPVKNVSVKLDDDGEILVKTPYIMKEYFKLPELTNQIFDEDGYYRTGDIGKWVDGKFLQIIGRKKDIFKVVSGSYIVPEKVEKALLKSPLISQTMVFEQEGHIAALIVPDTTKDENNLQSDQSLSSATLNDRIKQEINKYYNQQAMPAEQIHSFQVEEHPWTIQGGELTPTMKIKRDVISQKFASQLQNTKKIYS